MRSKRYNAISWAYIGKKRSIQKLVFGKVQDGYLNISYEHIERLILDEKREYYGAKKEVREEYDRHNKDYMS